MEGSYEYIEKHRMSVDERWSSSFGVHKVSNTSSAQKKIDVLRNVTHKSEFRAWVGGPMAGYCGSGI
jgi:hypothetical protein